MIRPGILLHAGEVIYSLLLLAWFFVPFFSHERGGLVPPLLPLSFLDPARSEIGWFLIVTCIVYPIPLIAILKIAAAFLNRRAPWLADSTRNVPILLNVLLSLLALCTLMIQLVTFAAGPGYFRSLPWLAFAAFFASIAWNAFSLGHLLAVQNRRDPSYREYIEYRRKEEGRARVPFPALRRHGIGRRVGVMILPFVLVIIVVPALVMMRDFSRTSFASAVTDGKALAERTANVVNANGGAGGSLANYLALEGRRNRDSRFPFRAISFVERDARTGQFEVAASTDRSRIGKQVRLRGPVPSATSYRLAEQEDVFEFTSPVTVAGTLAGYVSVEVDRSVVFEPYFRAMVKILLIAAVSVYAAIFLSYLFGRSVVFPILSLWMSVSEVSHTISDMIGGRIRVAETLLKYKDRVRTQDEVKLVSNEVAAMTRVIRGVFPYVSASTLAHSERQKPRTEKRNLAFLFTDIRGFTTFCEGRSPDRIVEILNRYLDMQTGIILANGGDVDKFVGDSIMAVFKGADREMAACRAADQIRAAMSVDKKLAEFRGKEVLSIGIGIHSGPVVFGSIGARDRMDFTSIGDTVNLAARLEGANKSYGTRALISEVVHEKAKNAFLCREIDLMAVQGRQKPVRIFELLDEREKASDRTHEIKRVFEEGLALYRRQVWEGAEKCFHFLKEKFQDEASEAFLLRIEMFKATPPSVKWDGVFRLAVK